MAIFFISSVLLGALLIGSFFWQKIVEPTATNKICDNGCEYCLNHQVEVEHTIL